MRIIKNRKKMKMGNEDSHHKHSYNIEISKSLPFLHHFTYFSLFHCYNAREQSLAWIKLGCSESKGTFLYRLKSSSRNKRRMLNYKLNL